MPRYLVSSQSLAAHTVGEALRLVPSGFDGVELGVGLATIDDDDLTRWRRAGGLALAHNYFPPPPEPFVLNLASTDRQNLARGMALCQGALEYCARHDLPLYSVHAGFCVNARPEDLGRELAHLPRIPKSEAREVFVASLSRLARRARELGVALAVENNVAAPMNLVEGRNELLLGVTPGGVARLIADSGERVSVLLDFGHLKVSAAALGFDPAAALKDVGGLVHIVHASDNSGLRDENLLLQGRPWFTDIARSLLPNVEYVILETVPASRDLLGKQADLLRHIWG